MRRLTILNINKTGDDQYSIQLTKQGDEFPFSFAAGSKLYKIRVDSKAVGVLHRKFEEAVDAATDSPSVPGIATNPFITLGKGLFSALLPSRQVEDLRRELASDDSPLLITTDDPDPFWEYMNDGEGQGFFCLKRDVGRSLKIADIAFAPTPRPDRKWRCLMIADPTGDLPGALEEAVRLRDWFEQRDVDCENFLTGSDASYENVLTKLLEEYDIIHYAGHIVQDDVSGEVRMRLHANAYLTPDTIRTFVKGGSIVFLNGCRSARAVRGLADAFISVGTRVVLGSLFDTPDAGGRVFAETFYANGLSGKPVGEAVRLARQSVIGVPAFAATWACFIMYGDPTGRLDLRVDELQSALNGTGLSRLDFDIDAAAVMEAAVRFGAPVGSVSTSRLFAAMVGGADAHLRDCLRAAGVPPDSLQRAFQEVFRLSEHDAEHETGMPFSPNALAIVRLGQKAAQANGRARIGEKDLLAGFVEHGGGAAGEILRHLGVRLSSLSRNPKSTSTRVEPDGPSVQRGTEGVVRVGAVSSADCSPAAWQALLAATELSVRSGAKVLSTSHLMWGLNQDPAGALAHALRRLQISLSLTGPMSGPSDVLPAEVPCSKRTAEILLEAQAVAAAAQRPISDGNLLKAFVRCGAGEFLAQKGLVLDALASELFVEDGGLDFARFDESVQSILDATIECATNKRHPVVGRRHVLYALLVAEDGLLPQRLADQGRTPSRWPIRSTRASRAVLCTRGLCGCPTARCRASW